MLNFIFIGYGSAGYSTPSTPSIGQVNDIHVNVKFYNNIYNIYIYIYIIYM